MECIERQLFTKQDGPKKLYLHYWERVGSTDSDDWSIQGTKGLMLASAVPVSVAIAIHYSLKA